MNLNINTKYETSSNLDPHQNSDNDFGKTPTFNNNSSLKINFSPSKNK